MGWSRLLVVSRSKSQPWHSVRTRRERNSLCNQTRRASRHIRRVSLGVIGASKLLQLLLNVSRVMVHPPKILLVAGPRILALQTAAYNSSGVLRVEGYQVLCSPGLGTPQILRSSIGSVQGNWSVFVAHFYNNNPLLPIDWLDFQWYERERRLYLSHLEVGMSFHQYHVLLGRLKRRSCSKILYRSFCYQHGGNCAAFSWVIRTGWTVQLPQSH